MVPRVTLSTLSHLFLFDFLVAPSPCLAFFSDPPASASTAAAGAAFFFFFALPFAPFDLLLLPLRGDSGGGEGAGNSSCRTAVMSTSPANGSRKLPTNPVQPPILLSRQRGWKGRVCVRKHEAGEGPDRQSVGILLRSKSHRSRQYHQRRRSAKVTFMERRQKARAIMYTMAINTP